MLKLPTKLAQASLFPLLLLAAAGLSGCVTTSTAQPGKLVEQPLTPEPQPVPYRTEIAIARINEIVTSPEVTDEQRARLFYDRGVMYDSVGLRSLARFDFLRALRLQPDMADAYNFIGIHHTLVGNYTEAYESFDAAYANNQVKAHEETIELFKKQANTVTDDKAKGATELKAFAQKMLPALEKHLAHAKELQAKHPSK